MDSFLGSLRETMNSGGTGGVFTAVLPLLKILTLGSLGLLLAHSKFQLVPKATFSILSKLVFALFLPCLIFTHLGPTVSYKNIVTWWFIPVNVVVSTGIGCALGFLVAFICRPPHEYFRFTIIMTAFGNTGNIPIAIVSSVCHNVENNPFSPDCYGPGVAYVSFSQWVSVILVYTLVYHMMEPPLEYYDAVEEEPEIEEISEIQEIENDVDGPTRNVEMHNDDLSIPLFVEAELPGLEDKETEHCKRPFIAKLFNSISGLEQANLPDPDSLEAGGQNSPRSIRCLAAPKMVRRMRIVAEKTPIRHILQPPTVASLLAIIVGVIPQLKSLCFGDDTVLSVITDSLDIVAGGMVPSTMLVLGAMLAEGPNESKLGLRTTIGIMVARFAVLPLLGIGVILLAERWNFLITGDELYKFVLLLQYTTPSALLIGAIANLRGYAVREASALLFWEHAFALFTLTIYLFVYFKFLLSSS